MDRTDRTVNFKDRDNLMFDVFEKDGGQDGLKLEWNEEELYN